MNIKTIMSSIAVCLMAMTALNAGAANIDANEARLAANSFLKQQATKTHGKINAPALSDIRLAHAEPSKAVSNANVYYAFNIKGGGFVIVAGEDRASRVLGYSDKGRLDWNNLPYGLKGLLDSYKEEIEFLMTYEDNDLVPATQSITRYDAIQPLIKTTWGQEMPYYLQCPIYQDEYCVVGCVATAMAQVMKFWQYPTGSEAISSYYCYDIRKTVPALPATTFEYNLMLNSYCHWDWDNSELVQDTYTDAQAQAVAKLGRYCGQAVEMGYSPEGSGAYTSDQLSAMKTFGFTNSQLVSKGSSWWWWGGDDNYTTEEWEAMIMTELNAGRPILYSASDTNGAGGHAFICDGYNTDGMYFHFNMGWYGTCDGWYLTTALNMTHRDGEALKFNSGHEMIIGIEPPEGWEPPTPTLLGDVDKDGELTVNDVTMLIDYLLSGDASNGIDLDAADVDGDNDTSISDVTALIDLVLNA